MYDIEIVIRWMCFIDFYFFKGKEICYKMILLLIIFFNFKVSLLVLWLLLGWFMLFWWGFMLIWLREIGRGILIWFMWLVDVRILFFSWLRKIWIYRYMIYWCKFDLSVYYIFIWIFMLLYKYCLNFFVSIEVCKIKYIYFNFFE